MKAAAIFKNALSMILLLTSLCSLKAQTADDKQVFIAVESAPKFPGGIQSFYAFLSKAIRYPDNARENNIQGRVIATFVVEKDGALTNIKVLRSPDESLSKETERVLSMSPKWIPGTQQGKAVRVQYTVPVQFNLGGQKLPADTAMRKVLIIIDGVQTSKEEFDKIPPTKIKSINVLKGKNATDKYGEKGINGAVEVITKP